MSPEDTLNKILALPHVIEVNPDADHKRAALNLHNGMLVQLPKPNNGLAGIGGKPTTSLVTAALPVRIRASDDPKAKPQDQGTSTLRYLNGPDMAAILATWTAQVRLLAL